MVFALAQGGMAGFISIQYAKAPVLAMVALTAFVVSKVSEQSICGEELLNRMTPAFN